MKLTKQEKLDKLKMAVALLQDADASMQAGFPFELEDYDEECYAIHSAIECAADDIIDVITRLEEADAE
jgi:hypothetical protein